MRNYFIFIMLAGIFGSVLSSGSSDTRSVDEPASDRPSSSRSYRSSSSPSPELPSGTVELKREYNGHFYADVQINGSPIRVLVDTGASGIALSRDDAQRAGIAVSAGMFEVVGQGADGDVHGEYVKLDRISLGDKTAEGVSAVVLDSGNQSLLGQSFLSKFDSVQISGDTMILR